MIIDCVLKTNQPAFFKEIFDGKVKIATIKAKTKNDEAELEERAFEKNFIDGKLSIKSNMILFGIIRMRQALTGHKRCGWEFDFEITEDNIGELPDKYYDLISKATFKHDKIWNAKDKKAKELKEGISKN